MPDRQSSDPFPKDGPSTAGRADQRLESMLERRRREKHLDKVGTPPWHPPLAPPREQAQAAPARSLESMGRRRAAGKVVAGESLKPSHSSVDRTKVAFLILGVLPCPALPSVHM